MSRRRRLIIGIAFLIFGVGFLLGGFIVIVLSQRASKSFSKLIVSTERAYHESRLTQAMRSKDWGEVVFRSKILIELHQGLGRDLENIEWNKTFPLFDAWVMEKMSSHIKEKGKSRTLGILYAKLGYALRKMGKERESEKILLKAGRLLGMGKDIERVERLCRTLFETTPPEYVH